MGSTGIIVLVVFAVLVLCYFNRDKIKCFLSTKDGPGEERKSVTPKDGPGEERK
jgi:hypothetical protein